MNILDPAVLLVFFENYHLLFLGGVFAGAFLITYQLIPKILWVVNKKNLLKPVLKRSAHSKEIPSFGGVAFFAVFVLLFSVLQGLRLEYVGNHLVAAMIILFIVGLKDDLVVSSARAKLMGELAAAAFIVFSPALELTNLHGFLGIYEISPIVGCLLSGFLVIAIINAYNLIDGINGLAGIVGVVICAAYGVIFYQTSQAFYVMICCLTVGILLAFLRFNMGHGKSEIFMGDSGSLIIGLIISFLTIKVMAMPVISGAFLTDFSPENRILFVLAVLFVPLFDTSRVMIKRILNGKSPFKADRGHSHHILLDLGWNHTQASVFLGAVNLCVIALFFTLEGWMTTVELSLFVTAEYGLFFIFFEVASAYLLLKKQPQMIKKPHQKPVQYQPNYIEQTA